MYTELKVLRSNKRDNKTFLYFGGGGVSRICAASTVSVRTLIAIGLEYKRSVSYLEYKSQQV